VTEKDVLYVVHDGELLTFNKANTVVSANKLGVSTVVENMLTLELLMFGRARSCIFAIVASSYARGTKSSSFPEFIERHSYARGMKSSSFPEFIERHDWFLCLPSSVVWMEPTRLELL